MTEPVFEDDSVRMVMIAITLFPSTYHVPGPVQHRYISYLTFKGQ